MEKKILVIEDDKVSLLLLSKMLTSYGACPFFASNGKRGLTILDDNPSIDLLICDYKLPDFDGFALIEQIRDMEHFAKKPIILVSAYLTIKAISSVMDAGASSFIPKPIHKKDLFECLDQHLAEGD